MTRLRDRIFDRLMGPSIRTAYEAGRRDGYEDALAALLPQLNSEPPPDPGRALLQGGGRPIPTRVPDRPPAGIEHR